MPTPSPAATAIQCWTRWSAKETYSAAMLNHAEEVRVQDVNRYLRMGQELQRAVASEASANRAKTEFLANMSHDIRTPHQRHYGYAGYDCRLPQGREKGR